MKIISIYFFLFICMINGDNIKIKGLQSAYTLKDNFEFWVVNDRPKKQYFFVTLQRFKNDEWRELFADISNPISKTTTRKMVGPHKRVKFSIPVEKFIYPNWLSFEKFRLKVVYGNKVEKLDCTGFSDSFKITRE